MFFLFSNVNEELAWLFLPQMEMEMKLMELNWQKSRYMKTITADECTRSEVRVGTLQTDHFALPKPWNTMLTVVKGTFVLQAYHRLLPPTPNL